MPVGHLRYAANVMHECNAYRAIYLQCRGPFDRVLCRKSGQMPGGATHQPNGIRDPALIWLIREIECFLFHSVHACRQCWFFSVALLWCRNCNVGRLSADPALNQLNKPRYAHMLCKHPYIYSDWQSIFGETKNCCVHGEHSRRCHTNCYIALVDKKAFAGIEWNKKCSDDRRSWYPLSHIY